MSTRKAIFPANPHALYKEHGYSPAVQSGDLLFVSGMVGAREDGSPEADLKAQVQLAFDNLEGVLAAGGCSFDDVIDLTFFMTDPERSVGFVLEGMKKAFPREPLPNVTAVGVNWLAGFQVEIKVTARIPSQASPGRNKAILEKANAAIKQGNHEGFLASCTEDTEWTFVGGQTLRGKEAVRQWMAATYTEPPHFAVDHLIAEGEFVVALGEIMTRGEDGKERPSSYCDVWRFRDGKMAGLRAFVVEAEDGGTKGN